MGIRRWLRELTASPEEQGVLQAMRAPLVAIGALAENTVGQIIGVVEPLDDRRLVAPLSRRSCVCWGLKVQGGNTVMRRRDGLSFALVEHGERAIVDPRHASMLITSTEFSRCHGYVDADPSETRLLEEMGYRDQPLEPTLFQFSEWIVTPGTRVAVVGSGTREPDLHGRSTYRELPTAIWIAGTRDRPISITDEL